MVTIIEGGGTMEDVFDTIVQQLKSENVDLLNNDIVMIISTTGNIIQDGGFAEATGVLYINENPNYIIDHFWYQ